MARRQIALALPAGHANAAFTMPLPERRGVTFECRGELFAHLHVDGLRTFATAVRLGFEGYPRTLVECRKP